jgi:hypothetical protein
MERVSTNNQQRGKRQSETPKTLYIDDTYIEAKAP